jgi:hypothetical protein
MNTVITKSNPFMPSHKDIDNLKMMNVSLDRTSNSQWLKFVKYQYIDYLYKDFPNKKLLIEDQKMRGENIALQICEDPTREVILLDGHGRMLFWILYFVNKYKPNKINKVKFIVSELNETVNQYHNMFLPSSCTCILKDINQVIESMQHRNPIVYANFCNIDGGKGIKKISDTVNKCNIKNFNLSFCIRMKNYGQKIGYAFRGYSYEPIQKRKTFGTYYMKLK